MIEVKPSIHSLEGQLTLAVAGSYGFLITLAAILDVLTNQPILSHYAPLLIGLGKVVAALIAWFATLRTYLKVQAVNADPTSVVPAPTDTNSLNVSSGVSKAG